MNSVLWQVLAIHIVCPRIASGQNATDRYFLDAIKSNNPTIFSEWYFSSFFHGDTQKDCLLFLLFMEKC